MTAQPTPPKVTSEISGLRATGDVHAVDAAYFALSDRDGRNQAGLVILLDSLSRPVRAELHIYEDVETAGREFLARQSQQILQQRYYSRQTVPLRIYDAQLDAHPINVAMPTEPPPGARSRTRPRRRAGPPFWIWAVIAVVPIAILVWLATQFLGGSDSPLSPAPAAVTDAAAPTAQIEPSTTALPPSINARSDIAIGQRVRIVPGLKAYLLSEPDTANGQQIGFIADGEVMTVRDGPVMRQGTADTIVWWLVVTDAGIEGWAPANTSELTLLEPVTQ